jgi:hypothetical protein
MAVTVTDNRTILWEDGTTNINQGTANTTDYAEATGSVSFAINIGTDQLFFNGTIPNFLTAGNELVYIWSSNTATQNGFDAGASSSHGMWMSDGTDQLVILMAGNDRVTFQHAETQVQFQCFLFDFDYLDEANTASRVYVNAGSVANFDETAVTEIGSYYVTTSKALAGGFNAFIDIIRYGGRDDGIQITGGGVGTEGAFVEICVEDRSTANGKAHGILREYTVNTYGCQGTLRFGDTGTANTYFHDSGVVVVWEDRLVDDDKYALYVDANSTGTNEFELTGCTIASARPGLLIDMSAAEINSLQLVRCNFVNTINAISFPTDTNGTTRDHDVTDCVFDNTGQVDPGTVVFERNSFTSWTSGATGALLLDADGVSAWLDLTFECGVGAGHAIYITATGTYNLNGMTFNNQQGTAGSNLVSSSGSTDASVYNFSGGAVTLNMSNSTTPSVRNGAGATTTVNNNVTITVDFSPITVAEVRVYETGTSTEVDGIENTVGSTFAFSVGAGVAVDIVVIKIGYEYFRRNNISFAASQDFLVPLRLDRNNPA